MRGTVEKYLGVTVRDKITGFTGMVTAVAKHLHGCDRVWIEPPMDKEGKLPDGRWFDEPSIEIVTDGPVFRPNIPPPVVGG